MALNGISTLSTKQAKQVAKLDLSEAKRDLQGNPRSAYDLARLPTNYSGNDLVDTNNAGGLLLGRPWVALAAGIYRQVYSGYFNDNVHYFTTPASASVVNDIYDTPSEATTTTSFQYTGYFKAPATATYTFYTASDDASYIWIGMQATTGYTTANALVAAPGLRGPSEVSNTIDLVAGAYYPIRVQYGNNQGPGELTVSFSTPNISKNRLFTNCLFHNPVTNGI